MRYLELEDLIVNAFIYYNGKTGKRALSLNKIFGYGQKVISQINEKTNNYTGLKISDERTEIFFRENECFKHKLGKDIAR